MIFSIFLILPCLVFSTPTECSEEMCKTNCEFGFFKDENGDKTCQCLPNPCIVAICPSNTFCKPIPSPEPCQFGSCDPFTAYCEPLQNKCDPEPCGLRCMYGLEHDSNGCQICQCLPDPCIMTTCPVGTKCIAVANDQPCFESFCKPFIGSCEPKCEEETCEVFCLFGLERDERGCEICKCKPNPCQFVKCPKNKICSVLKNGKTFCRAKKALKCPDIACPLSCSLRGTSTDENGCTVCVCLENNLI